MIKQKMIQVDSVVFGKGVRVASHNLEIIGTVADNNTLLKVYPWGDGVGLEIVVTNPIEDIKRKLEICKNEKDVPVENPPVFYSEREYHVMTEAQKLVSYCTEVLELNKKLTAENKDLKAEIELMSRIIAEKSNPINELNTEFVKELYKLVESHKVNSDMA